MLKKIFCLALAAVLCCTPVLAAPAPEHRVAAKGAILYELSTDTVLLEQDADMKLYPASTTKLMTALVAMEYGNPQDVVTVTRDAVDGLYEQGSASYLLVGEEISFMDLMRYLLIGSGNDAANALAIHVSGSVENFVELMNNTARELGCTNTHFVNPHGLHDEDHYTTARDLLKISLAAMKNETIAQLVAETEVVLPVTNKHDHTTTKYTTNHLISKKSTREYFYEGAIGIKTGYTTPAGMRQGRLHLLFGGAGRGKGRRGGRPLRGDHQAVQLRRGQLVPAGDAQQQRAHRGGARPAFRRPGHRGGASLGKYHRHAAQHL